MGNAYQFPSSGGSSSASNLISGTLDDARLSDNVTKQGNNFNASDQLVQLNSGRLPAVDSKFLYSSNERKRYTDQTRTNSTTFLVDNELSAQLVAGIAYNFKLIYYFTTISSSGVKVDLNGGDAVFDDFHGDYEIKNLSTFAIAAGGEINSPTDVVGLTALGTITCVEIKGSFLCGTGGSLIPRFAQNAETVASENVVAKKNSNFCVSPAF